MKIAVPSLPAGRRELAATVSPAEYGAAAAESGLRFRGSIAVRAVAHKMHEQLFVSADVSATLELECARCLEPFDRPVAAHFEVLCVPETQADPTVSRARRAEVESQRILYYGGGVVDLADRIIEAVQLALPMKPLCRDDCKGLCPTCGRNLNDGPCGCPGGELRNMPFRDLFR